MLITIRAYIAVTGYLILQYCCIEAGDAASLKNLLARSSSVSGQKMAVKTVEEDVCGDWKRAFDVKSGRCYYGNLQTGESRWEAPPEWIDDDPPPPPPYHGKTTVNPSSKRGKTYIL